MNIAHRLYVVISFLRLSQNKTIQVQILYSQLLYQNVDSYHKISFRLKRWQHSSDYKAVIIVTNLVTFRNDPVADNDNDIVINNAHIHVVNQSCQCKYNTISCRFINLNCKNILYFLLHFCVYCLRFYRFILLFC